MIPGKLYEIKFFYWLVYETKQDVRTALTLSRIYNENLDAVARITSFLQKYYDTNVSFLYPYSLIVPLEIDEDCNIKVLSSSGIGWIKYPYKQSWTYGKIVEVNKT